MASTSYNGFPPAARSKAGAWLRREYAAGRLERPARCCACGQRDGVLDAHAEDYTEPFGPHLTRYPLCFLCHMMLHCRFRNRAAWDAYRAVIGRGRRFPAFTTRDFRRLCSMFLDRAPADWPPSYPGRCPEAGVLDRIDAGTA